MSDAAAPQGDGLLFWTNKPVSLAPAAPAPQSLGAREDGKALKRQRSFEPNTRNWSSGLFECFADCWICIYGCLCPAYLYGKTSEFIGRDNCWDASIAFHFLLQFCCLHWIPYNETRADFREKLRAAWGDLDPFHAF